MSIFTFLCFSFFYVKCFLSERELKKELRDKFTREVWLGPSKFGLVRSEHAHASYPELFFRPPGFSSYMGRKKGELRTIGNL